MIPQAIIEAICDANFLVEIACVVNQHLGYWLLLDVLASASYVCNFLMIDYSYRVS